MQLKHYAYVLFSHFCASSFLGRIYSSLFEKSAGTLHTTTSSFPPFRVFIFSLTVIDVFLCHCFFWILGRFPKCIPLFFPFSQPSGPLTLQPCSTSPNTKRHMLEKKKINLRKVKWLCLISCSKHTHTRLLYCLHCVFCIISPRSLHISYWIARWCKSVRSLLIDAIGIVPLLSLPLYFNNTQITHWHKRDGVLVSCNFWSREFFFIITLPLPLPRDVRSDKRKRNKNISVRYVKQNRKFVHFSHQFIIMTIIMSLCTRRCKRERFCFFFQVEDRCR